MEWTKESSELRDLALQGAGAVSVLAQQVSGLSRQNFEYVRDNFVKPLEARSLKFSERTDVPVELKRAHQDSAVLLRRQWTAAYDRASSAEVQRLEAIIRSNVERTKEVEDSFIGSIVGTASDSFAKASQSDPTWKTVALIVGVAFAGFVVLALLRGK